MAKSALVSLAAVLVLCVLPVHSAPSEMQNAIADYSAKNYGQAISTLRGVLKADSKNEKARYYLALSLQALGKTAEAKTEYLWLYQNGKDGDLKYKSWQGLSVLSNVKTRSSASVTSTRESGRSQQLAVSSTPYKPQAGEATSSGGGFTRGCFKH